MVAVGFLTARALGRRSDVWNLLALAGILLLVSNPLAWQDIGTQLSFATVAAILMFAPKSRGVDTIQRRIDDMVDRDAPLRHRLRHRARVLFKRGVQGLWRVFSGSATVAVIAFVVSAPILALHFGELAPSTIVANTVAVPTFFVVLCTALVGSVVGLLDSVLAVPFLAISDTGADFLFGYLRMVDSVGPLQPIRLPSPSPWIPAAAVCAAGFAIFIRRHRLSAAAFLASMFAFLILSAPTSVPSSGLVSQAGSARLMPTARGQPAHARPATPPIKVFPPISVTIQGNRDPSRDLVSGPGLEVTDLGARCLMLESVGRRCLVVSGRLDRALEQLRGLPAGSTAAPVLVLTRKPRSQHQLRELQVRTGARFTRVVSFGERLEVRLQPELGLIQSSGR
jgi:hypothetical protein